MITFEELVRVVTIQQEVMEKMHEVLTVHQNVLRDHDLLLGVHEQELVTLLVDLEARTDDGK